MDMTAPIKPGYKQTEVGVIPEDWDVVSLYQYAQVRSGIAKNANVKISDPIRVHYLRVANVQDGFLDLSEMSEIEIERGDLRRFSVVVGDVLMNEGGDRDKLGRGCIWSGQFNPCVHQNHVFVVRCTTRLHSPYLTAWTRSAAAKQFFINAGSQTTNLASINKSAIGKLPIPLPPTRAEQEAIAGALADADALIESLEQLVAKKRQIKHGAMQELLTGRKRLPGFTGEWETKRLGELGRWTGGMTPSMRNADYWKSGTIPWVSSGDVKSVRLETTGLSITEFAIKQRTTNLLPKHSIIVVTRSGILRKYLPVAMNMVPMAINQDIKALLPSAGVEPEYVLHAITSSGDRILASCLKSGTTVESVEFGWLKAFTISFPPTPAEQSAIAAVLSDMDAEITALESKLAKARQVKQGMMQELLTGRTRLV